MTDQQLLEKALQYFKSPAELARFLKYAGDGQLTRIKQGTGKFGAYRREQLEQYLNGLEHAKILIYESQSKSSHVIEYREEKLLKPGDWGYQADSPKYYHVKWAAISEFKGDVKIEIGSLNDCIEQAKILQEVLADAIQRAETFQHGRSFHGWRQIGEIKI